MKLLIALALFAVACADEIRVVQLPDLPEHVAAGISLGQIIIPNDVMEAIKAGFGRPVLRDGGVDAEDDLAVNFVDTPEVADAPGPVNFVDFPEPLTLGEAPLPAFETDAVQVVEIAEIIMPEAVVIADVPLPVVEAEDNAVRFVDSPQEVAVEAVKIAEPILPEVAEIVPEPVLIAESPVPVDEEADGIAVNFVDSPVEVAAPEPISLPEPALPAYETAEAPVEAVKVAVPQFNDYRGKIFDNPMLR